MHNQTHTATHMYNSRCHSGRLRWWRLVVYKKCVEVGSLQSTCSVKQLARHERSKTPDFNLLFYYYYYCYFYFHYYYH